MALVSLQNDGTVSHPELHNAPAALAVWDLQTYFLNEVLSEGEGAYDRGGQPHHYHIAGTREEDMATTSQNLLRTFGTELEQVCGK